MRGGREGERPASLDVCSSLLYSWDLHCYVGGGQVVPAGHWVESASMFCKLVFPDFCACLVGVI